MPAIVQAHVGQPGLAADAAPLHVDVPDRPGRRAARKQIRAVLAVARDGVDHRTGGARQPHRARPRLRIRKQDALALDPVPFQRDDLADPAAGQQQQADDGDDVRAPELVTGEHGVEPGQLLGREIALLGRHPVAPVALAGVLMKGPLSSDARGAIYSMVTSPPVERFGVWCCRVGTRWHRSRPGARTQLLSGRLPAGLPVRPSIPLACGHHVPEAGPI